MALPDHFEGEDVIIVMQQDGDTRAAPIINMEGKLLSWNLGGGAQNTEDVFTFGGRTFNFKKPREKFTLEFEIVINNSDFDFVQFGSDTTGAAFGNMTGRVVKSSETTSDWRIIMFFQASGSHIKNTTTPSIIVPSKTVSAYRMIFTDAKAVTFDKEFSSEDYFKGTLTFEISATDSDGYANMFQDEGIGIGTTAGTTLASMTTIAGKGLLREAKGYLDWVQTAASAAWDDGTTSTKYRYTG